MRPNATVIVAVRTHVEVLLELLANIRMATGFTLFPNVRRNLQPFASGLPGLFLFAEPRHWEKVQGQGQAAQCSGVLWLWGFGVLGRVWNAPAFGRRIVR